MCIGACILLFVVVVRIFLSILFTFVPRWFFTPSGIYTGEWVHWHCQPCQIKPTVVSRVLHCIVGHRNLNSYAGNSKKSWCGNYKICEYDGDMVLQSFVSSIIRSSDLLPKMGLQNDARHDFARRMWGVNNPETMSNTRCWKLCRITNVILSAQKSRLPCFLRKHDWWNKPLCIWICKCDVRSCITLDQ